MNLNFCKECGEKIHEQSIKYCMRCRSTKHNVMKRMEVVEKNRQSNKPYRQSKKYKKLM
ncbi:MAG: hypothetical protein ACTSPQ_21760 [Candidatus Helarchaeota archaeon]